MIKTTRGYPKIPDSKNCPLKQCIAFEKYDGTNTRFLWEQNRWTYFGTRRFLFSFDEAGIEECRNKYSHLAIAPALFNKIFASIGERYQGHNLILYAEFLGDQSFAGFHKTNDPKRLILIDAEIDGKMLPPQEFLDTFSHLPESNIARVIYQGKYSGRLAEDVRKGKYDVDEGVVIKGIVKGEIYRAKIKTDQYLQRLQEAFQSDWEKYWE